MTGKAPPTHSDKAQSNSQQVPLNIKRDSYVRKNIITSVFQSNNLKRVLSHRVPPLRMNRRKNWVRQKRKSLTSLLHITSRSGKSGDQTDLEVPPLCPRSNSPIQSAHSVNSDMEINASSQAGQSQIAPKTTISVRGNLFKLNNRFTYIKSLGLGAYGIVIAAKDEITQRRVAVKKVSNVFDDLTDAKRIIREIRLLRSMNHDNVLKIIDIDDPADYNTFNDVYIVTELMDTDLAKLLRSSAKILDSQRKFFIYHILRALQYIHSANIMHRDLKPANILVSESCDIKICDFGLARYVDPVDIPDQNMTEYVVTRWYRAPELLLANDEYTCAIDMWSVGCILAELYARRPLFQGHDVKHQLELICVVLGKPTSAEIQNITNSRAREFVMRLPEQKRFSLRSFMSGADEMAIDLAERLLIFDPAKRLSANQALEHPYVSDYRDKRTEAKTVVIDTKQLEPPSEKKLGKEGTRWLMWNEILAFHPEAKAREPAAAKDARSKFGHLVPRPE